MESIKCPTCGAPIFWNTKSEALKCQYCGSAFNPEELKIQDSNSKYDKDNDTFSKTELRTYHCDNCHAEVITASSMLALQCIHCGYSMVDVRKTNASQRPDLVLPFHINKNEAIQKLQKYFKQKPLTPKVFKKNLQLDKTIGMYIPFWLHSFKNTADATMHCENTTTKRDGDDKVVITHQYNVDINGSGYFERIPTDAIVNLNDDTMDALEPYDYGKLQPFNPGYMSGYYSEYFNIDSEDSRQRAENRAREYMKEELEIQAGNFETKKTITYNDKITEYKKELAILPVWVYKTTHKGKEYTFAVNGETGEVVGKSPISISKLLAFSTIAFVITQIIGHIITIMA